MFIWLSLKSMKQKGIGDVMRECQVFWWNIQCFSAWIGLANIFCLVLSGPGALEWMKYILWNKRSCKPASQVFHHRSMDGQKYGQQYNSVLKSDHLVVSPPTWMVIIAAYSFLSPVPVTHVTPQVENICCGWVAVGSRSFTEVKKMNRKSSWKWNSLS